MLLRSCSRAVKGSHETEQESAPFRGIDTAQTASLTGSGNVWRPADSWMVVSWPGRTLFWETVGWKRCPGTLGRKMLLKSEWWVLGMPRVCTPPATAPPQTSAIGADCEKLWARSVGSVPPWRQLYSDVPGFKQVFIVVGWTDGQVLSTWLCICTTFLLLHVEWCCIFHFQVYLFSFPRSFYLFQVLLILNLFSLSFSFLCNTSNGAVF